MPEFNPETKGGTMRLGVRKTLWQEADDSVIRMHLDASSIRID